jgi:hypothetical protein
MLFVTPEELFVVQWQPGQEMVREVPGVIQALHADVAGSLLDVVKFIQRSL